MLARLNHPNIVTIHDFGQAGGFFYLLMEFVDGVNLRQAMKVGRFTPAQALAVVPKICEALQFAHNEGILHRDIKPENILLDSKGRVKIADFGIAKLVEGADLPLGQPGTAGPAPAPNLTETGKVLGTPQYMAPEQFEHPQDVDQRADIYSLGVVFYEMLTGELPLGRFAPPSEKSTVDPRVDEVVLRTLEKQRERRTRTADEVKTQVETIATTPATDRDRLTSPAESRVAMSATITLRRPWSLIMVAALFIVTGCLAAWDISSHIGPNYRLNFGLLGLPIGIGLLRLRPRWRAVALLLPWVVLVILAVVGVMASNVGVPVRATSPTHIGSTIICLALGVMWFVWMNGILIRADVSALFQAGKRPHPWIEWAAMVGAIAMAFLVSLWTGPKPAVDVGLPSPSPAASAVSSFGPVVERTINRASTRSNFLLSFKTGELRTPFPENDKPVVDIHRWAHREGLDAAVGVLNGDNDVMTGFDMAVLPAPAQCWEELTPADAAARFEGQPAISFVILLYANGSYPETCVFKTRDGGIGILQLTGYVSEPPGVKIRYKFVDKVPAPTQTESNAVATGSWSPTLWPGEKPELRKILDEAEKLTATAHFEEALQRYLWYGGHAREFGGSASDYSLLSQWVELGRRYPKAKQALMKIRDQAAHAFQDGGGYSELFQKVAGINAQLQDDEATYALFKSIQDQDPSLAQQCYFYAESLLVKHGDYELCINCMGDPQQKYDTARHSLEMGRRFGSRTGSIPMRSAQLPTKQCDPVRSSHGAAAADADRHLGDDEEILGKQLRWTGLSIDRNPRRRRTQGGCRKD
jgi:tetratricopeptide (TPR) repeat protein